MLSQTDGVHSSISGVGLLCAIAAHPHCNTVVCNLHVILTVTDVVSLQLEELEKDSNSQLNTSFKCYTTMSEGEVDNVCLHLLKLNLFVSQYLRYRCQISK